MASGPITSWEIDGGKQLVGVKIGIATMENTMAISQKTKKELPFD